ncbi:hypothetical protein [Mycobacterium hubeiense]|uniref:hypothetical protein n=1 Tax=Mycobacterium hubeiense TaxID=1867256 RepID=UPI000C7F5F0A|nr:hypothetical protein [Mycobacterium sp. QGD 101]
MIAVSVVATVLVLRPDSAASGRDEIPTATEDSEVASANDTGPANIITEDPTCDAWGGIARDYVSEVQSVNWADRDSQVPASDWTDQQRVMYETVGRAMTDAADLAVTLQKQTPHRVMRELYGQFMAYAEAFADAIPTYTFENADSLANVPGGALSALSAICSAIDYKSAQPVALQLAAPASPAQVSPPSAEPKQFIDNSSRTVCEEWISSTDQYDKDTQAWLAIDANIPASEWTAEQKAVYNSAASIMTARADAIERMGRESNNAVIEDFAVIAAQYLRAYVLTIPKYTSNDNFLSDSARYLVGTVHWACKAVRR